MNMSALFYKYDDNVFFKELTHHCGMLEDIVVEAGNHPRSSENEQRIFGQEVQKQLETIYNLIDKSVLVKIIVCQPPLRMISVAGAFFVYLESAAQTRFCNPLSVLGPVSH